MALQEKTQEFILGFSMEPNQLYSFLVSAIASSPKLRFVEGDKTALKARFACLGNDKSVQEYYIDFAISFKDNICDIHFFPETPRDSNALDRAVSTVMGAISSHGGRVIEANVYTMLTSEPSSADIEKIGTYLGEHGLVTLGQISEELGITQMTVDIGLHRLIDNGVIGYSPLGSVSDRFYFHK
jgi:hypothetical protein